MKAIAIYGAGGHSKVVADIAKLNGYTNIIFIDDKNDKYLNFETFLERYTGVPIALGIGNNMIRHDLYKKCIQASILVQTLVHPSAIISEDVHIGDGTVIMANTIINSASKLGNGCILNTACVIEHDATIGNFVHISPMVACAGNVKIGHFTHIGIGSCIIQNICIGDSCVIGAGSVIISPIIANSLAYGNPCKIIKGTK